MRKSKALLVVSQTYVPDPAAVGQHMHDAAAEMARRGYDVLVLASGRGYEDPSVKYKRRETLDGVRIRRLPLSSFGKRSIAIRLFAGTVFLTQAVVHALFMRRLDAILVSTSPPICPLAGVLLSKLRRAPVTFWAMDINPDQMIAMGKTAERSVPARMFEWMYRLILRHAHRTVALDQFMGRRLEAKVALGDRMVVNPPWSPQEHIEPIAHENNPFRARHDLQGKFVIMYSGNISPAHPVDTILQAAERLQDEPDLVFLFVGGGLGREQIDQFAQTHALTNVRTLPYQPIEDLKYSLSAADVHLISMGPAMVGIVHPCKVYGAMGAGRPILLLGPRDCHVGQILDACDIGWQIDHDDVDGAVAMIRKLARTDRAVFEAMGGRGRQAVADQFNKDALCGRFCDVLEGGETDTRPVRTE